MSTSPNYQQDDQEHRHLLLALQQDANPDSTRRREFDEFVENLAKTIEDARKAREQGWRLLSVGIEEDEKGRCWLKAHMKRCEPLARRDIEKAA